MKILVIFTGGTIGSSVRGKWISPNGKTSYSLLQRFCEQDNSVEFETKEPYLILSENLSSDSLNRLIECVADNIDSGYDGIIVTHGTDTLQYSACALSYAFGNKCIPTVLVSSNYTLTDERTNGYLNFEAAVSLIREKKHTGVFTCYSNDNETVIIHKGGELLTHGEMDDKLFSAFSNVYGEYVNGAVNVNPDYVEPAEDRPLGKYSLTEKSGVLVISSHPGDSYNYDLTDCKAVILRPYHSGTLNTDSVMLQHFCERARGKNIPMFVVNAGEGVTYGSAGLFDRLGIIPLPLSAFVSVYMKTWIAVSLNKDIVPFVTE